MEEGKLKTFLALVIIGIAIALGHQLQVYVYDAQQKRYEQCRAEEKEHLICTFIAVFGNSEG